MVVVMLEKTPEPVAGADATGTEAPTHQPKFLSIIKAEKVWLFLGAG